MKEKEKEVFRILEKDARTKPEQLAGMTGLPLAQVEKLIKKAEELVKETTSAREQLTKTLDTYNSIFADDVKDVRKAYKGVEGELGKSEKKRDEVRKKLEPLWDVADLLCPVPPVYGLSAEKLMAYGGGIASAFYG